MAWNFERLGEPFGDVLDGPLWDGGGLLFCTVLKCQILRYDAPSEKFSTVRSYTHRTSGLALGPKGQLYGAQSEGRRVVQFKDDGSTVHLGLYLDGARYNHPHDLVVDGKGRIWFSDPHSELPPRGPQVALLDHGSILRLDYGQQSNQWTVARMTEDTVKPQGLALSPDEATLYVADSPRSPKDSRRIKAYPIKDDGTLGRAIVLHTFSADDRGVHRGGAGMCVDSDGNILVTAGSAACGPGSMIYVFAPSGQVLESHRVPTEAPTNCTFGGKDLATLFVTTADGNLFQVKNSGRKGLARPQARGLPAKPVQ